MRRNLPICTDFDEDLMDDFGEFDDFDDDAPQPNRTTTTPIHSDNWTIVNAFNVINEELDLQTEEEKQEALQVLNVLHGRVERNMRKNFAF